MFVPADKTQPPQMQTGNTGLPIIIVAVIAVVAMISVPIVWDRMKRYFVVYIYYHANIHLRFKHTVMDTHISCLGEMKML